MADYSAAKSVHPTLTTSTEDVVTLTGNAPAVEIVHSSGTDPLFVRVAWRTSPAAIAASYEDDTDIVVPGGFLRVQDSIARGGRGVGPIYVRLYGDANIDYSVIGVD